MFGLAAAVADLVLPRSCVGCGRAGGAWCLPCRPGLPARVVALRTDAVRVTSAADYDGAVRAALLAYKERGRRDLAAPLASLLTGAVEVTPAAALVPVPSAPAAVRERGGDHVLRLARRTARRTDRRLFPVLRLDVSVRDSAGLGVAERAVNLSGAMVAQPPSTAGATVVIVDDIVTTGATLTEAARALRTAGWEVAGAAVVAATPLRARREM
jgi:predicted amidophosphoribosyltransferase